AGIHTFHRLERVGDRAFAVHDQPDAGLWEFRTRAEVHTHSSVMCWAACDRLARIASQLGLAERARQWQTRADRIRKRILQRAWNSKLNSFVSTFEGAAVDASVLLMHEVGFIRPDDPRFVGTVAAVERQLKHGSAVSLCETGRFRQAGKCLHYLYVLVHRCLIAQGRMTEARELFENMLACRNHLGLLSEDINPATKELWGDFPQTYSLVGLMNCAMKLSKTWEDVV
ncbi:MAG TPA: glycoside hydrolase family 15 protein, partial [Hyphomicrobiaceae bacterium]|nr:glycoside hydrolase family 15 protein [Hyphomicrobiaceae bacterium]